MMKKLSILGVLMLIGSVLLHAQNRVTGSVVADADGSPLPGVNITIKGTTSGTTTDANGRYAISVPDKGKLVFSFIGYLSQEVTVGKSNVIDLRLSADTKLLSEVVVVGYGSQVKRDVTGAISTVRGADIAQVPVPSFDAALQGRAAGLQVSQAGGAPGSVVRVQVRGTGSISSGTEPLYVIDGMIVFQDIAGIAGGRSNNSLNPLANINPNDIESIEVLKDAAATAIYGSRGANGVIIVTTKTGKKGQARTTVDFNQGVSNAVNLIPFANGQQWLQTVDQARQNSVGFGIPAGQERFDPLVLSNNNLPTPAGISGPQFGPLTTWTRTLAEQTNTDWVGALLQQGRVTEANLSTSNGFDRGGFFISGQYRDEEGILKTHRLQRYAFRANLDFAVSEKVKAGAKVTFSYLDFNQPQVGIGNNGGGVGRQNFGATGGWAQANAGSLPIMPIFNPDGTYFDPLRGRNVVAGQDPNNFSNRTNQNRTIGTAFLEYRVFKDLSLRGEASVDFLNSNSIYWTSDVIRYNRVGEEQGRFVNNRNFNGYATYTKRFGEDHDLQVVAGTEVQKIVTRRQDYAYEGLVGSQQEIGEIANGATQFITAVSGIFGDRYFLSYFGRANYKFKDRYLFGLSFRRDGSTAFGPNNRFGNFPAASAGWIISNEKFAQNGFLSKFNLLKVRASYGITGNANIPSFAFLNNFINWPVYGNAPALGLSVLANPNITWEQNRQFDAALEFGILNNRISGSVGYYNRLSQDMLLNVPVAPNIGIASGSPSVITNIGDLRNSGFELQLSSVNINKGGFQWRTDLNFSTARNRVERLTPQFEVLPSGTLPVAVGIQSGVGITQIGGQLATFYLAEYAGLDAQGYETIFEIDQNILRQTGRTVKTGNVLRATQQNINANRIVHEGKTSIPTWFGGINNTFSYKGIELTTLFTFQGGNYIYDGHEELTSYVRTGTNNIRASVIGNTWTEQNQNAIYPRLTWNMRDNALDAQGRPAPQVLGTRTTRFLHKGDFLRLRTLQVAYNLPRSVTQRLKLQNVRVYANGQNLWTLTQFPGLDPEMVVLGGNQDRNLNQGLVGNLPLPQVRTWNAGLSITF
ncbi:MAG: SusC/RagA family TonB-linked outer membrane protein [Runella sp.]